MKNFLSHSEEQHSNKTNDLENSWNDYFEVFQFKILGFKVSGSLEVGESAVVIKGELPFAALLFKGQIEDIIRAKAMELLGENK